MRCAARVPHAVRSACGTSVAHTHLLEDFDLLFDDVELELLVKDAAADARDGALLLVDIQSALHALPLHLDHRVEARILDVLVARVQQHAISLHLHRWR